MAVQSVLLSKEKVPLGELLDVCDVALALIQERGQIFKLLRADAGSGERNDVFDAAVKRLKVLEEISDQIRLAFRDAMMERGGMEAKLGAAGRNIRGRWGS
jgi:hypothetical protein